MAQIGAQDVNLSAFDQDWRCLRVRLKVAVNEVERLALRAVAPRRAAQPFRWVPSKRSAR